MLELTRSNPDSINWDITYEISEVKEEPGVVNLASREGVVEPRDEAPTLDIAGIQQCSNDSCSEEELTELKEGLQVAGLSGALWSIIGLLNKFNFSYNFNYEK